MEAPEEAVENAIVTAPDTREGGVVLGVTSQEEAAAVAAERAVETVVPAIIPVAAAAPENLFEQFKINRQLLNAVAELGFTDPTPVQRKAIPLLLAGQDLLGIAQTGTGKTAAFGLPLLMKVKYAQGRYPRAVVLAPTRELVLQITEHLRALGRYTDLRFVALYGGLGPKAQADLLAGGIDIVISTPGRLWELYAASKLVLKEVKTLILDEADRMLDMGFAPQIRRLLEVLPRKRQNALFSATMPERVVKLSEEFLEAPQRVEISMQATPAETVSQLLYRAPNQATKLALLNYLMAADEALWTRVLVFARAKPTVEMIADSLRAAKLGPVRVLHGNKGQNARMNAMDEFKAGHVRVLVATDVAARGIDVTGVSHVVNFDVPAGYDDYVHRIGRTGRAGLTGASITFATSAESWHIRNIEKLIRQPLPVADLPAGITPSATPFEEAQQQAREIDHQKRLADPDFQGSFHEKVIPLHKQIDKRTGKLYDEETIGRKRVRRSGTQRNTTKGNKPRK
jgi:ATP-dependent RNA helicase RhlE